MSSFNSSAPSGRRQLSRVLSSRAYILELVQKLKNHDSSIKINSGTFSGISFLLYLFTLSKEKILLIGS